MLNLKEIIKDQQNMLSYNSLNFTIKLKQIAYQSILNILERDSEKMISYLLHNSRTGGFQHKLFQEYISILEKSLPFTCKKYDKIYSITSLLDSNLNIFDGISHFEEFVSSKLEVSNSTKEFYIGGRKATYTNPFYIGKLLDIFSLENGKSLIDNVEEYSFFKIKLKNVIPGTRVKVSHLRIPPHYQMGAMNYINKARQNIVSIIRKLNEKTR